MHIKSLKTHDEIAQSFDAFLELRPHLRSKEIFVTQVMEQYKEGYEIIDAYEQEEVVACIGFSFLTTFAWGKILYIDDLITKEKTRSKGYGKILLDHVIQIAREHLCKEVHLDTGYARHAAHKVYLKQGFEFNCHHLALKLT
ncbi:GNAT family N-acetyltransferase [Orientia tsutsugamushi]|uniref:GNAT family N-acetyltransferase n=1 Tax=Orientia tsutsugamushi TaxID=784 RepID=UPI003528B015